MAMGSAPGQRALHVDDEAPGRAAILSASHDLTPTPPNCERKTMFKKTPSSIDDYRAEFDQAQAEIFAADTEARRLEALPTSRGDTLQMLETLIQAETKRCRAPLAGFLLECSRNVPLRHGGLRGVILQRLNACVPGRNPTLDDLVDLFLAAVGPDPLIKMVHDVSAEIDWPNVPDGPEREKQIAAAVQRRERAKALAGEIVDRARQCGFVFP